MNELLVDSLLSVLQQFTRTTFAIRQCAHIFREDDDDDDDVAPSVLSFSVEITCLHTKTSKVATFASIGLVWSAVAACLCRESINRIDKVPITTYTRV